MQDFKRLKVWQRAHALALEIHRVVVTFPRVGFGELRLQLTSAADSIASNIAEGSAASTQREFARYLDMAIRTTSETEHHLICARDRGALGKTKYDGLSQEADEIRRMLFVLRRRVLAAAEAEEKAARAARRRRSKARLRPRGSEPPDPPQAPT